MKNGNMWTFFMRKIFKNKEKWHSWGGILPQVFHLNSEKFGGGEYTHKTNLILGGVYNPRNFEGYKPPNIKIFYFDKFQTTLKFLCFA